MAISRMNMERQMRNMGGLMELEEPRQGYFLGKIVRKAKKAVKKVIKSPIGKAAILGAIGFGIPGTQFGGLLGRASFGGAAPGIFGNTGGIGALLGQGGKFETLGNIFRVGGKEGAKLSVPRILGGIGIGSALAAPFLMGGDEEVIDEGVDVTGMQPMVENIRQQARDYYQDPTKSALYFMPPKSAVRFGGAFAGGGLADIPREGYRIGGGVMNMLQKAEAAEKLLQQNTAEMQQEEAMRQQQDPLTQIQQRELAIKEQELMHKKQMDLAKLELEGLKLKSNEETQKDRLESEDRREGVRIAAKLATDASKEQQEEAKIVMEAAKQLQNE